MLQEILNVGYWDLICFLWKFGVCALVAYLLPMLAIAMFAASKR